MSTLSGKRYLTTEEKAAIRNEPTEITNAQLGEKYGVHPTTIMYHRTPKKTKQKKTSKATAKPPLSKSEMDGTSVAFDNGFITIRMPAANREILKSFSSLFGG